MHRRLITPSVVAFVVLSLSLGLMTVPARADVTISAAPSLLEVSATPGGFGSQDVTVTNSGSEPFTVSAEIAQYKGASGSLSAANWLTVDPASFELAPGQRRSVRVTIPIPSDAESGGRYAMVAFRTGGKPGQGSTVGVAAQVGVPFLITVKGTGAVVRQPSIEGLVPVLETNGQLGFRVAASNKGNVHFYARGAVELSDAAGKWLGTIALRDSTAILPGTKETLLSDQTIIYQDGANYRARAAVTTGEGIPEGRVETEFSATTGLEIEEVVPQTVGSNLMVRLLLKNKGGLGLLPRIMMAVRGDDGKVAGVLSPSQQPFISPGQSLEVEASYPGKLSAGSYALVARAEFGAASAQREAPFKVGEPAAKVDPSIPVSKWAAANTSQVRPEVAGAAPLAVIPVQPAGGESPSWPIALASMSGLTLAGLFVFARRRGRPRPSILDTIRVALPSPRTFGFGAAGQTSRGHRRYAAQAYRVEVLPPPIHFLPPPVEWKDQPRDEWKPIVQPGAAPASSVPGVHSPASVHSGAERGFAPSSSHTNLGGDGFALRPRSQTRLARAVAEKAAALVNEASRAAQLGDRASVDRLSRQALKLDPWNIDAWLWLAASCQDPKSARLCLDAVLLLDPNNARARRGVASIDGRAMVESAAGQTS